MNSLLTGGINALFSLRLCCHWPAKLRSQGVPLAFIVVFRLLLTWRWKARRSGVRLVGYTCHVVPGDGGHQLGTGDRCDGIHRDFSSGHAYNNIPVWRYADIQKTLGCRGWWCGKASSLARLDQAFAAINDHSGAVYLEILIPPEAFPVSSSPLNAL